jgi:hypothetical protein
MGETLLAKPWLVRACACFACGRQLCVLTYGFWPANNAHTAECTEYKRVDTDVELFTIRSVSCTNTIHGAAHAPGADETGSTGWWSFI